MGELDRVVCAAERSSLVVPCSRWTTRGHAPVAVVVVAVGAGFALVMDEATGRQWSVACVDVERWTRRSSALARVRSKSQPRMASVSP